MFGRKRVRKSRTPTTVLPLFKQLLFGLLLSVFVSGVVYGLWHFVRLPSLTINDVEVRGGDTVAHEDVVKVVNQELEGEYRRLIPKRFAWTYPELRIVDKVKTLPRVSDVKVTRQGRNSLLVEFEEYRPSALWCTLDAGGVFLENECLFIDKRGYAFAEAPALTGSAFVRYVDAKNAPTLGSSPFNQKFIAELGGLVKELSVRFAFETFYIEKLSDEEVVIHLTSGGVLKVNMRRPFVDTVAALTALLSSKEFQHLRSGNFEYIDLRYDNKAFVKEETESKEELTEVDE